MAFITWNMADARGQVWNHPYKWELEAWIARRNELLATVNEALKRVPPSRPYSSGLPGGGYPLPADGGPGPLV